MAKGLIWSWLLCTLFIVTLKCQEQCSEGYYIREGGCTECHPSCKACTDYFQCSICSQNYLKQDDGTCQWQPCQDGFYYSVNKGKCAECEDSCLGKCAYRAECFDCPSESFYDLATQTCVDQCGADQITINADHDMFLDMNMCRDFEYYVDVLSEEVVELGTKKFPYKELESVFIELLHLHSNKPHKVKIFIKEGTSNYLYTGHNYVVNMTRLEVTTYTDKNTEAGRALVIGTDNSSKRSVLVISSMLNVLKSDERPVTDVLTQYDSMTIGEISSLMEESCVVYLVKTNMLMNKIDFSTEHMNELSNHKYIRLVHPKGTWLELFNSYVDVSGMYVQSYEQSSFRLESIYFKCYRVQGIISSTEYCMDPTQYYESEFHANNITIAISNPAIFNGRRFLFFLVSGGNLFLSNIYMAASPDSYYIVFFCFLSASCKFPEGTGSTIMLTNATFTSDNGAYNQNFYRPFMFRAITDRAADNTTVYLKNVTLSNAHFGYPVDIKIGPQNDLYISDLTITGLVNIDINMIRSEETGRLFMENIHISDMKLDDHNIMKAKTKYLSIKNMTVSNLSGSLSTVELVEAEYLETVEISGCLFTNISLEYETTLVNFHPLDVQGEATLTNCRFVNHYLAPTASLIRMDPITKFSLLNTTFSEITSDQSSNFENVIVDLSAVDTLGDLNIAISEIEVTQCNIPILKLSIPDLSSSASRRVSISGLHVHDFIYENNVELVSLYQLYSHEEFIVELDQLTFKGLAFVRGGTLLSLQHQLANQLTLSNSIVQDVENARIFIGAYDLSESSTLDSIVLIQNMSAHNVYMNAQSLIEVGEAGNLQVHQSSFSRISSILSGAVIMADDYSTVLVSASEFLNNTSVKGGVFMADSRSQIKVYGSTISNNFAVSSGVISIENDAHFEFYGSHVYHNFGHHAAVTEIFSTITPSIIDHCTIENNIELTEIEILEFIEQDYIHPKFCEYIKSQEDLVEELSHAFAIEVLLGSLVIHNGTVLSNQDKALYSVYSTLEIDGMSIYNTQLTSVVILAQQGTAVLKNFKISNITASSFTSGSTGIISLSNIIFELDSIEYHDSLGHLLHVLYSSGSISNLRVANVAGWFLISSRSTELLKFENSYFDSVSTSTTHPVKVYKSKVVSVRNITLSNFNHLVLYIEDSEVKMMNTVIISNSPAAFQVESSIIDSIDNLRVLKCGSEDYGYSGGVYSRLSNISIVNSEFIDNKARVGAAVHIDCSPSHTCFSSISNTLFANNSALEKGGGIYYNLKRPETNSLTFANNSAPYGPDIASYAVKVVREGTTNNQIYIHNVGSGIKYGEDIRVAVLDNDGQVMNQESTSSIKIVPSNNDDKVSGLVSHKLTNGTAHFSNLVFSYSHGSSNVRYKFSSTLLSIDQIRHGTDVSESNLYVSFRHCMPGEVINGNKCIECGYGSYSFKWNATKCENCMSNAECLGRSEVKVDSGYWRESTNSTYAVKCLNKDACAGGYSLNSSHPVQCKKGYKGILCASCDIVDNTKYQEINGNKCVKCPNPALNAIRVTALMILAVAFMMGIIILNIRKRNENQSSILLRILTNYLQIITISLSFTVNIPESFNSAFSTPTGATSPDEVLFSFDCFLEDSEVKAFTPSTRLFKVFLLALLPVALILLMIIFVVIFICIAKLIKPENNLTPKRYVVVSIICIIFLLHPNLTLEALSLFQCIKIDDGVYQMKLHMEYGCFSANHVIWILALGLPMIVIWVIGMPLIALLIIVKHRRHLEKWRLRKYMLLLYQGLKPSVFYWEFVNTFRKLLILMIITFMAQVKVSLQILVALTCIMVLYRIQLRLKPYKLELNNKIETLATISSLLTMASYVLTADDDSPAGFTVLAAVLMFAFNLVFILQWTFLFMLSWNIKYSYFKTFLMIYSVLICKQNLLNEDEEQDKTKVSIKGVKTGKKMRKIKKRIIPKSIKGNKQKNRKINIKNATNHLPADTRRDKTTARFQNKQFIVHENEFRASLSDD